MFTIHVFIHVKPEFLEPFIAATLDNARNSIQEPGVIRFDVLQQEDDPTRFVLRETYRVPEAQAHHRETAHYARWRATCDSMMAEPRYSVKYTELFPEPARWEMPHVAQ